MEQITELLMGKTPFFIDGTSSSILPALTVPYSVREKFRRLNPSSQRILAMSFYTTLGFCAALSNVCPDKR